MYKLLIIPFLLIGCSKTIIPETGNQLQVLTYAEHFDATIGVNNACRERIFDKDTCVDLYGKLRKIKAALDNEQVTEVTISIFNYVRGKL